MRPSVEEAKSLQRSQGLEAIHLVWLDDTGFVIAHTDYERRIAKARHSDMTDCDLHIYLSNLEERPSDVERNGWYRAMDTSRGWSFFPLWGICYCGKITPHLSTPECAKPLPKGQTRRCKACRDGGSNHADFCTDS